MWLHSRSAGRRSSPGSRDNRGSRPRNGSSPRTTRPAEETIATRRCDNAGPVTQGRVLKSGHSTSARRLAWSGGKSVSLVTEPLLASARGDGSPRSEELITCFRSINLNECGETRYSGAISAGVTVAGATRRSREAKPRWPRLPAPRAAGACAPGHGCRAARSTAAWPVRPRDGCR